MIHVCNPALVFIISASLFIVHSPTAAGVQQAKRRGGFHCEAATGNVALCLSAQ